MQVMFSHNYHTDQAMPAVDCAYFSFKLCKKAQTKEQLTN